MIIHIISGYTKSDALDFFSIMKVVIWYIVIVLKFAT